MREIRFREADKQMPPPTTVTAATMTTATLESNEKSLLTLPSTGESDALSSSLGGKFIDNKRHVKVYTQFTRIGEIDEENEKFYAEVRLESRWYDLPSIVSYDPDEHWNPQLYVENAMRVHMESVGYEVKKLEELVEITETRLIYGFFWQRLDLEEFPLDVAELSVSVGTRLDKSEIALLADPDRVAFISQRVIRTFGYWKNWKLHKMVRLAQRSYYDEPVSNHHHYIFRFDKAPTHEMTKQFSYDPSKASAKLVSTCFCTRRANYFYFNTYLSTFVFTLLSLLLHSINCKMAQNRLMNIFILIALLTVFKFSIINGKYLKRVYYLTSLDKYVLMCLGLLSLNATWHAIVASFWTPNLAIRLDRLYLLFSFVLFLLIHIYVLIQQLRCLKRIKDLEREESKFISQNLAFMD